MVLLCCIFVVLFVIWFIKWIKLKLFLKRLGNYYELMYSFDTKYNLIFTVISPVRSVRPRSEYSGFTAKVYFDSIEAAEAERQRIIEFSGTPKSALDAKSFYKTL